MCFRSEINVAGLAACLLAAVSFASSAQAATQVGVTAAVLPQASGTPPQAQPRVLRIGLDIVRNERVTTDAEGKLQLLFVDGSALTMGPNSDVVVDSFVYDPEAKTGELAFSATKGLFRLVGGRISKTNPVTFRTPTALIGIRGGIMSARVSATRTTGTLHFGELMTMDAGAGYMHPDFWNELPNLLSGLSAFLIEEDELRLVFGQRSDDIWEMAERLASFNCRAIVIKRGSR